MKTGRIAGVVIGLLVVGVLCCMVWWWLRPGEPEYDGKKLSAWLDELRRLETSAQFDSTTPQVRAIREFGTNAIPWLVGGLAADEGRWGHRANGILDKQSLVSHRFSTSEDHFMRGVVGFRALGEDGAPAIPSLLALVEKNPGYVPGALAAIGRPAVPALEECLANMTLYETSIGTYAIVPGNTISSTFNAVSLGPLTKADVAVLIPIIEMWAVQTTNSQARSKAVWFLEHFDSLE